MIHTLTEICYDLKISKGSRTRAIKIFKEYFNIEGEKRYVSGHAHKVLTYTDKQYKILIKKYPNIQIKRRKPTMTKKRIKDNFSRAQKPSENRKKGYYMTIQDYDMISAFQGRAV